MHVMELDCTLATLCWQHWWWDIPYYGHREGIHSPLPGIRIKRENCGFVCVVMQRAGRKFARDDNRLSLNGRLGLPACYDEQYQSALGVLPLGGGRAFGQVLRGSLT